MDDGPVDRTCVTWRPCVNDAGGTSGKTGEGKVTNAHRRWLVQPRDRPVDGQCLRVHRPPIQLSPETLGRAHCDQRRKRRSGASEYRTVRRQRSFSRQSLPPTEEGCVEETSPCSRDRHKRLDYTQVPLAQRYRLGRSIYRDAIIHQHSTYLARGALQLRVWLCHRPCEPDLGNASEGK